MDSVCVYEEKTVIHELTQGLQMAELLRLSLHSPEARDFFIEKILSSYANALVVLQSGHSAGQPPAPALPAVSLPESSISFGSPQSEEFEFGQPFTSQQGDTVASSFSFPSTSLGPIEDFNQLGFPNHYEDELSRIFSPPCISPATPESFFFAEWGSSPSSDFQIDLGFESNNCFF